MKYFGWYKEISADRIKNILVDDSSIADGRFLSYNSSTEKLEYTVSPEVSGSHLNRTEAAIDYNPSALTNDYIISVTNCDSARSVVISTEDVESGTTNRPRVIVIKDESGNAGSYNITISLENGGTIDGASSHVMNQPYQSIVIYMTGTNGFIY